MTMSLFKPGTVLMVLTGPVAKLLGHEQLRLVTDGREARFAELGAPAGADPLEPLLRAIVDREADFPSKVAGLARRQLGELLEQQGKADEAIEQYRGALRIDPDAKVKTRLRALERAKAARTKQAEASHAHVEPSSTVRRKRRSRAVSR